VDKALEYGKDIWMEVHAAHQARLYFGIQAEEGGSWTPPESARLRTSMLPRSTISHNECSGTKSLILN